MQFDIFANLRYLNDWTAFRKLLLLLLGGLGNTVNIFIWTMILALPLGLIVALGRMSRHALIREPVRAYILVMRGTPLILQIFAIHFLLPSLLHIRPNRMHSTITAFVLNYAAYFAEIYRGGILATERGQHEAAQVLGFTRAQTFVRIILPQVVKRILLPASNEVITLVKDTALATVIAVGEIYRAATNEASRTGSVEPLIIAGVFYLIMNTIITRLFDLLIRKFDYYKV
ncbi:MAG: amino acid ABC transporter permease [Oscillospiraceae bacterium]|jgi:polar amino acid transport system permease protein|nr:amino acid ABC transporter permease [Oscillospiraceae bacterium]